MRNSLLVLFAFITSLSVFAETDSTSYWSHVGQIFHGTTNQVKGIKADNLGNVYYSGYGYEINPGNRHALIVGKMDTALNYVWKKEFFGFPTNQGTHSIVVDANHMYITGAFTSLELGDSTYTSATSNNAEIFMVCLDASDGTIIWSRNLGRKDNVRLHLDGNNDLVLGYAAGNGVQQYDGQILDTLFNSNNLVRGYAYLTLNNNDGTLQNFSFGRDNELGPINLNALVGRKVYSLIELFQSGFNPRRLELRILDLNTQTITYNLAVTPFAANAILGSQFIQEDKSWIIFARHQNNNVVIDSLVIPNPTGIHNTFKFSTALKLDSNLQLIDYITYSSALDYEYSASHDTTLVFTFGADGNGYIINDGVVDTAFYQTNVMNFTKGYFVASCNLNFENFTYRRFSVQDGNAGWQTGMELKGLDIDNGGNIYAAAFHENDIIALPDTIDAYNKSWKHLSVIAKVGGGGLLSSLNQDYAFEKNSIAIYPNPTLDVLHVKSQAAIRRLTIIGPTGAVLGTSKDSGIDVTQLSPGVYVLLVETEENLETLKFVK